MPFVSVISQLKHDKQFDTQRTVQYSLFFGNIHLLVQQLHFNLNIQLRFVVESSKKKKDKGVCQCVIL